jgi:catechol 2,3-dioxygenase-like lactoylglutathione lyase family enzyme
LKNVSALSLFVEDVQAAKAFYTEVFDVPLIFEDDVSAVVKFDNVILNLLQVSEAPSLIAPSAVASVDSGSRFLLSIWVDDVDAVLAELKTRGVTILSGPIDRAWGMRTIMFSDPSGHHWEIAQGIND